MVGCHLGSLGKLGLVCKPTHSIRDSSSSFSRAGSARCGVWSVRVETGPGIRSCCIRLDTGHAGPHRPQAQKNGDWGNQARSGALGFPAPWEGENLRGIVFVVAASSWTPLQQFALPSPANSPSPEPWREWHSDCTAQHACPCCRYGTVGSAGWLVSGGGNVLFPVARVLCFFWDVMLAG